MDCEERLVAQAELVKSVNPAAHVWVYRNLVKALPVCMHALDFSYVATFQCVRLDFHVCNYPVYLLGLFT